MVHSGALYISKRRRGPSVAGPGVTYPHIIPSRRACLGVTEEQTVKQKLTHDAEKNTVVVVADNKITGDGRRRLCNRLLLIARN